MDPRDLRYQVLTIAMVAAILLVCYAIYFFWWKRNRHRARTLARRANRLGLQYFPADPFGLDALGMPLFDEGDTIVFANVLIGEWSGLPFKAAELTSYTREWLDSAMAEVVKERMYSVLVAELDVRMRLPATSVAPETFRTKAAAAVGRHDLQFESGEFNDRFFISSADRRFAYQLIDARMMHYLLGYADARPRFEVRGSRALVALPRVRENVILDDVVALFRIAGGFADHIPRVVWTEQGATAQRVAAEQASVGRWSV